MNLSTPGLYFHTIRYLKPKQILYRLAYKLKSRHSPGIVRLLSAGKNQSAVPLNLLPCIERPRSFIGDGFRFLNLETRFGERVDWRYSALGKLWCYNLNYFDFLNQNEMGVDTGLDLMQDFITAVGQSKACLEPYPISLRAINWIKFLNRNEIRDQRIDDCLYGQVNSLAHNLEHHLLGNHLLENGIALYFAAFYFRDPVLLRKARKILCAELDEQILSDGAHFELSPMYHHIILDRLLDCINLAQNNPGIHAGITTGDGEDALLAFLRTKASLMLGWLREMTFANGNMPLVNDAALGIAPDATALWTYADRLGVAESAVTLDASGYRKKRGKSFEILIDIGQIGPDYIPGHAHADTFSFVLNVGNTPVVVDGGTSTYENNELRQTQRSTRAHNTVEVDGDNQSEVWGSFRVARRARVNSIKETNNSISACHDGYKRLPGKPIHFRNWTFLENGLEIRDEIKGVFRKAIARFHFHPDVHVQADPGNASSGTIHLPDAASVRWNILKGNGRWVETTYHPQFNMSLPNRCLEILFSEPSAEIKFSWQ